MVQLHLLVSVGALAGPVPPFLLVAMHRQTLPSPSGCWQRYSHKPSLKCFWHHQYVKLQKVGLCLSTTGWEGWSSWYRLEHGRQRKVVGQSPVCSLQQPCLEVLPPRSPNLGLWNDLRLLNLSSCFILFYFILLEEGKRKENGFCWCF